MGGDVFQIDANLAYVAAVCEMLIQSHEDVISLIPAIPQNWHTGSFRGFCARGGYELDAEWSEGSINRITVRALHGGICKIELPVSQKVFTFRDGSGRVYNAENSILTVEVSGELTLTV